MRTLARLVGFSLLAGLAACGGAEDGASDKLVDAPDPPEGGAQVLSPRYKVPAGREVFMCMRMPFEVTQDLYVQRTTIYQVEGGHHSIVYYRTSTAPVRDEPHECDDSDMTDLRPIAIGTARGTGIELPPGIALKVPKGARLYQQSHYLNLSDREVEVQDAANLELLRADAVTDIAGMYTQVDLGFELPAGQETTRTVDCALPHAMTVPWLFGHMHEMGTHFKVEITQDGRTETVLDSEWEAALRDAAPKVEFSPHLALDAADRMKTTCTWRNPEPESVFFPKEMCATFAVYYPSTDGAMYVCDETGETFPL